MTFAIRWKAASETGHVRQKNEDAWGAEPLEKNDGAVLLLVADGMGGHPGGEVASRLAVDACRERLAGIDSRGPAPEILRELFTHAHTRLQERAMEEPGLAQMGTTLTMLLLREDGGWVGHVGDSRLLWYRAGTIGLVTDDHSAAWERVTSGAMTVDEAERDPMGALLTRHLGPSALCEPDLPELPLRIEPGDRLLLCSDGLGKVVSLDEIARALETTSTEEALASLLNQVLDGGAPDNVTIVLADVDGEAGKTGAARTHASLPYRSGA